MKTPLKLLLARLAKLGAGFNIGLITNALVALVTMPIFAVPAGTAIRPDALGLYVFPLGLFSFFVGVPTSAKDALTRRMKTGYWGMALNLCPVPLCFAILDAAVYLNGLTIKP